MLVVANQAAKAGGKRAGMWVLDVSDFKKVSTATRLEVSAASDRDLARSRRPWFNGGVRIFRAVEGPKGVDGAPPHVEEIGYYIPEAPPKNPSGTIQINHAIVDDASRSRLARRRHAHRTDLR